MKSIRYEKLPKRALKAKAYGGVIKDWTVLSLMDNTFKVYGTLVKDELNCFAPNTDVLTSVITVLEFDPINNIGQVETANTLYNLSTPHIAFDAEKTGILSKTVE